MYDAKKLSEIKNADSDAIKYFFSVFLKQALSAAAGFLAAVASVRELTPFGSALAAGIFTEYIPSAVLGSAAGCFFSHGVSVMTLRYIASCAIAGILAYFFKRNIKRQYSRHFSAIAGFVSIFSTGLVISISITLSVAEIALYLCEGAISGAAAYFTDRCININSMKKFASRLSGSETASLLVVFCIVLLALKNFSFSVIYPAIIVGSYVVLVTATFGGEKYGALTGICAGVVIGFAENESFVTGGMALGGLFCGIFGGKNRFISAVIYVLTLCVTAFAAENPDTVSFVICGAAVAALALVLTPLKIRKKLIGIFSLSDDGIFLSGQRKALKMRIHAASDGMSDVTSSIKAVAGIYRRRTAPSKDKIYDNVVGSVCRQCSRYDTCWNREHSATYGYFTQLLDAYKRCDAPLEKDMPYRFFTSCLEPEKISASLVTELGRYRSAMRETVKTGETVNIVSDQFGAVSSFLDNFARTMESSEEYEAGLSEMVRNVIENDFGADVLSVGVFKGGNEKIFAEIAFAPSNRKYDYEDITDCIAEVLDKSFEMPETRTLTDGSVCFTVCEKTKYRVEYGEYQISSGGSRWCGDTYDSFYDGKGNFVMILSDGMGTGKKAAADSVLCCSLASKLLRAGFPVDSIIKMINSAMLLRSGEESLATLDIAAVDLYSGEVVIYKAGASFSMAMKHMKLLKAEKPSLPVGILRDVSFEKIHLNLGDGDSVVLMSDGVTPEASAMWKEILRCAPDYEGNELADKLAKTAVLNAGKDNSDDITVLTAVLTQAD